jgi:hypothetical protein
MADVASGVSGGDGVAFMVAATLVYDAIAAACSSPQTTELNAGARAKTLMKWVNIGEIQGIALVLIGAWIDKKHRMAILAGGATAAVLMYAQYLHAKKAGLASGEPGTESY